MSRVYFPRTAVASMITTMQDGSSVEIASVGNEGLVGLPVFLGTHSTPLEVFVQVEGEAVALPAAALRRSTGPGAAPRAPPALHPGAPLADRAVRRLQPPSIRWINAAHAGCF